MTADVVNLRQARKQKARTATTAEASQNRAAFGRTKAEREMTAIDKARESSRLDGHRREEKTRRDE